MIRRVVFGKAILASAVGALAWEVVVRVLILPGLPLFDLVFILGTMITRDVLVTTKHSLKLMGDFGRPYNCFHVSFVFFE